MTEGQLQLLLNKIEGLRQQLSAFSDVVSYEIRLERERRAETKVCLCGRRL